MDARIVARLADSPEFAALKEHFAGRAVEEARELGLKNFALPESHDRLEWERLRAFHRGVAAVFEEPIKARREIKKQEAKQ